MNREFGSGGAVLSSDVPSVFDMKRATSAKIDTRIGAGDGITTRRVTHPEPRTFDLVKMMGKGAWTPDDQGRRNTCTAFCVSAAAEVTHFLAQPDQALPDYSEEVLYAKTSAVEYRAAVKNIRDDEIARFERTGSRFLAQTRVALERGALVSAKKLEYDRDAPVNAVRELTPEVEQLAASSGVTGTVNHIVTKSPPEEIGVLLVGPGRPWVTAVDEGATVSEDFAPFENIVSDFISLLQSGRAIAAGFPLLEGADHDIWTGEATLYDGHVRYPNRGHFEDMDINGGHTVCIVGYETRGFKRGDGVFIFRNSFGRKFGWKAEENPHYPELRKGYGTISFHDVNWFCLEYLHL